METSNEPKPPSLSQQLAAAREINDFIQVEFLEGLITQQALQKAADLKLPGHDQLPEAPIISLLKSNN
jgi:hypothetical protein